MSSSEVTRAEIMRSGSSLANHSLNQRIIRESNKGETRIQPARKALRSQVKHDSRKSEITIAEMAKEARILQRVVITLDGYEGFNPEAFKHEIGYLNRLGTVIEIVSKDSQL